MLKLHLGEAQSLEQLEFNTNPPALVFLEKGNDVHQESMMPVLIKDHSSINTGINEQRLLINKHGLKVSSACPPVPKDLARTSEPAMAQTMNGKSMC